MDLAPQTTTHHTTLDPIFPSAPAFALHLTRMADTLLVWVGTTGTKDEERTMLAADWAVAMPSRGDIPATATPLFRTGASDIALPMAQRLAKRFPPNQIQLSLSLPSSLTAPAGPGLDPYASKALLAMEKKLGTWIADILAGKAE